MTASSPDAESVTITAEWPQSANAGARVTNIHAYQWDKDRTGIYLMLGHLGLPLWVAPDDRERWEQVHPDHRIPVETLGAFYMTEQVAKDFCRRFAAHLGFSVIEGKPDVAS